MRVYWDTSYIVVYMYNSFMYRLFLDNTVTRRNTIFYTSFRCLRISGRASFIKRKKKGIRSCKYIERLRMLGSRGFEFYSPPMVVVGFTVSLMTGGEVNNRCQRLALSSWSKQIVEEKGEQVAS